MRRALAAISLCAASACSEPDPVFSPEPIPLVLAGGTGGLLGVGTAGDRVQPFPMLIDTASPLTAFSDGSSSVRATRGTLTLFDSTDGTAGAARLELHDVQLLVTPLGGTGLDAASPISGVLGGDNLRRFVLGLRYDPTPRVTLLDRLILDDCDLSERCAAVLPFSLVGGRQSIDIGEAIYSYPASYVVLDACVEPALDPLELGLECRDIGCVARCPAELGTARDVCVADCSRRRAACGGSCNDCDDLCGSPGSPTCQTCLADAGRYLARGVDVRLAVSTGFPGLALTSAAYDRLRGRGAAAQLIAGAAHTLFLPDRSVETSGIVVGLTDLGNPGAETHDPAARAALALVGREGYFGACAELARSRRLRRVPPQDVPASQESCLRSPERYADDQLLSVCRSKNSSGVCDDRGDGSRASPYVELAAPLPVLVVPDTTSLLQAINADVRPDSATVEGIIGTELLRRLGTTLDYPSGRAIFTCADPSCRIFRSMGHGTDCRVDAADGERLFGGGTARLIEGGGCAPP